MRVSLVVDWWLMHFSSFSGALTTKCPRFESRLKYFLFRVFEWRGAPANSIGGKTLNFIAVKDSRKSDKEEGIWKFKKINLVCVCFTNAENNLEHDEE